MDNTSLTFQDHRTVTTCAVRTPLEHIKRLVSGDFAVLLPAFDVEECKAAEATVAELVELGCVELCCVGPLAEKLHDAIDWIIEEKGALHVVTTWHEDPAEACEYFIHTAGGMPRCLLGLIEDHAEFAASLKRIACGQS